MWQDRETYVRPVLHLLTIVSRRSIWDDGARGVCLHDAFSAAEHVVCEFGAAVVTAKPVVALKWVSGHRGESR